MTAEKYRHRKHINAVLEASSAKNTVITVLQVLCHEAEFDRPEVTITRAQIEAKARACRNSVLKALKFLKEEGTIKAVKNELGGRGNAVTYRLSVAKFGGVGGSGPDETAAVPAAQAATLWDRITPRIEEAEPDAYRAWLSGLTFEAIEGGEMRFMAGSSYHADYCQQHYERLLISAANSVEPGLVHRVKIRA